ncbi:MAG: ATP-binding protein [Oscillospiraceae bacterium]|nr:ATP-binding protein [Oscillospiraceae bacterium]
MKIELTGRIDSNNAQQTEKEIIDRLAACGENEVVLDAAGLEYISSAGLRVILRLKNTYPDVSIVNVSSEVYEILDMTGVTEILPVEKAYRIVSVEGCEEIGRGANGTIYRIDQDNVVKVYNNADALEDIRHEREVAKLALILGVPTAISYDVVKVGESYGSVFELLNARSFSKIISTEPDKLDWCVREYVNMLKKIHGTLVPAGKLPDMRETAISWARFMLDYLPEDAGKKLVALVEAVPHDDHMIHGDYHTKNLELQNDEVLLIDMDTLSVGHPVFELASIFNAFIGFSELDHEVIRSFQGFDFETAQSFWKKFLSAYLGTDCAPKLQEVEDKARIIGYTRLIRRSVRRGGLGTESGRAEISFWKERLLALLEKTDSLVFSANELELEASAENLGAVQTFVDERLQAADCPPNIRLQVSVAVEEIFVNIANYAYKPGAGSAVVRVEVAEDPVSVSITFLDHGVPYDPLTGKDPDLKRAGEGGDMHGLGVFMTKKLMDGIAYEYKNGQNILTLKKNL